MIFVKFLKKFEFGHVLEKSSILVIINEKFWFWWNCRKIWIFSEISTKYFRKKSLFVKIYVKMHFLFENFEKFDFGQIFEKFWFWSKYTKNIDFFENLENFDFVKFSKKISFWSKLAKMSKISIWIKFRKNLALFKFSKFRFWSKFRNISILVKIFDNFEKCRF